MATPGAQIDSLQGWLHYIDEQLTWRDTLRSTKDRYLCHDTAEYLKFGLHTELKRESKLPSLESPSEVFHELVYSYACKEKALSVFVHTLMTIGKKPRGLLVVQELKRRFGVQAFPPQLDEQSMPKKFFLFQCLLQIALKVKPTTAKRLVIHFGKEKYLGRNYRNIQHILDLFRCLWQKRVIIESDVSKLKLQLGNCRETECVEYLEEYACGNFSHFLRLPKLDDLESRRYTTTSAEDTSDGHADDHNGILIRGTSRYPIYEEPRECSDDSSIQEDTTHMDTQSEDRLLIPSTESMTTSQNTGHSPKQHSHHFCDSKLLVTGTVVFLLMLVLLVLGASLGFLWRPLYNRSSSKVGYVNETIVLQEVNHFYFQSIRIEKDVQKSDSPQNLKALILDQACESLNTSDIILLNVINAYSFDRKQNFSEYLMPGSVISYKINATSSYSGPEWMHITVTKGLQTQGIQVAHKVIHVGAHGKWKFTKFEYEVPRGKWDYYSLDLYVPKENQYRYNATVKKVKIESDISGENIEGNCTILESDQNQECSLAVSFRGIHAKGCLIGSIYGDADSHFRHRSVHIVITQGHFERGLACTAVAIGLVAIIMLAVAVFLMFKRTLRCHKVDTELTGSEIRPMDEY